ncbi:MAG: hypothetical protein H0X37_07135 [Herpetosiphonaceae bacterium]|nr:hypothetical protein [Herpetosiphonaceae bacterium]
MNITLRLDRLIPLLTLILAGFGIIFLLDAGPTQVVFNLGGDLPKIAVVWPLVLLVSLLAGVGVEFLLRAHPRFKRSMLTSIHIGPFEGAALLPWWILPALTPAAVFAFFRLFRGQYGSAARLGALIATGLILILLYVAQHGLLFGTASQQTAARTTQTIVAYGLAFAVFAAVASSHYRTLYAACVLVPVVTLLSYHLLHEQHQHAWTLALRIAFALVGSYWVLGFWSARFLLNAAALLLIFYAVTGSLQHADENGIPRHVLAEYGLIVLVGLLVLGIAAFGRH